MSKQRKLFCELCPLVFELSRQKEIVKRHVKNVFKHFASAKSEALLPVVVYEHSCDMIKRGPGIDAELQRNKADNIRLACSRIDGVVIRPGETFSFWHLVGKTSKRNGFAEGRVLVNGRLVAGVGGGLCNLAHTLCLLMLHSPAAIAELHHHSDALAPDPNGVRVPYSSGTSVNYNYLDLRFVNPTSQPMQLHTWCEGDILKAELRTTEEFPYTYEITEEDHHFSQEANGKYYCISRIYRETYDKKTRELINRELVRNNHSEVMYDYDLIPNNK